MRYTRAARIDLLAPVGAEMKHIGSNPAAVIEGSGAQSKKYVELVCSGHCVWCVFCVSLCSPPFGPKYAICFAPSRRFRWMRSAIREMIENDNLDEV